jgi:hypothetical protein
MPDHPPRRACPRRRHARRARPRAGLPVAPDAHHRALRRGRHDRHPRARDRGEAAAALGQPVVVDNRGGAGGTVAGEAFARSEPDGHTLLVATASLICINKALYARLPFDPDTDFVPVAMLAQQPNVLVVNPRRCRWRRCPS